MNKNHKSKKRTETMLTLYCPKGEFHYTVVPASQLFIKNGNIWAKWICGYCYPEDSYKEKLVKKIR